MSEMDQQVSEDGIARRRFLQHAAAAAWAAPVIVTMMSRTAHAQPDPVCGHKSGGVGDVDCTLDGTPCGSVLTECRGAPAGAVGDPCTCFAL